MDPAARGRRRAQGQVLPTELRSHFLPNYGGRDIGGLAGRFAELL